MGFKTLLDIDLVLSFDNGNAVMPLRKMYGEDSLSLFKGIHFMHLVNINSKKGVIHFSEDFKRFLAEETGYSVRKISYMIADFTRDGFFVKDKKDYHLHLAFMNFFKKKNLKYPLDGYEHKGENL